MSDWSSAQYLKFNDERSRPARDLLAQVAVANPKSVVDLGCGPGNSTGLLVARWPEARISGLDSSPDMLAKARQTLPGLHFEQADAATWRPEEPVDVVFSNAMFQWLPYHLAVLPRLMNEALAPHGILAVQMPDNLQEPTHVLMREVASEGPWAERLATVNRAPLARVEDYYDALSPFSQQIDLWHTIYNHPLDSVDAIVEWVKGTGLRPFIDPLQEDERAEFLARYRDRLATFYKPAADGKVLLRFPRMFMVARRSSNSRKSA